MDRRGEPRPRVSSRARPLFVGIDIGTTLTKAGIVDLEGAEVAHAAVPTIWRREATGGHALPEQLLASVVAATAQVLAVAPVGEIAGVGVTSMAETVVLSDRDGAAVGPAIAWHDVRATAEFAEMRRELGVERIGAVTGLGTSQIPTIATVAWLVRNRAEVRDATIAACVAEWIVARLGGDVAAEASLASRTGALAIEGRTWWTDALDWAGVSREFFPPVRCAGSPFGRVRGAPAGLERIEGAVLTVAGHDHLCAAVGIGAAHPRQVMDSCGTAEALLRAVPAEPGRELGAGLSLGIEVGCHVLAGHDALVGGLALGLNLMPVLERLGVASEHGSTALDAPALALHDSPGVTTAPAAVAELRARLDPQASGSTEPARMWRDAVAAAVAGSRRLLDGLERLGGPVEEVRVSGGWSRNTLLRQLKQEVFPPLCFPLVDEGGIRGAALLAGLAAGMFAGATDFPEPALEHGGPPQRLRDGVTDHAPATR